MVVSWLFTWSTKGCLCDFFGGIRGTRGLSSDEPCNVYFMYSDYSDCSGYCQVDECTSWTYCSFLLNFCVCFKGDGLPYWKIESSSKWGCWILPHRFDGMKYFILHAFTSFRIILPVFTFWIRYAPFPMLSQILYGPRNHCWSLSPLRPSLLLLQTRTSVPTLRS